MRVILKFVENGKFALIRETSGGKLLGYRKQVCSSGYYFPGLKKPPLKNLKEARHLRIPW